MSKSNNDEKRPKSRTPEEEIRSRKINSIIETVRKYIEDKNANVCVNVIAKTVEKYFEEDETNVYKNIPTMVFDILGDYYENKDKERLENLKRKQHNSSSEGACGGVSEDERRSVPWNDATYSTGSSIGDELSANMQAESSDSEFEDSPPGDSPPRKRKRRLRRRRKLRRSSSSSSSSSSSPSPPSSYYSTEEPRTIRSKPMTQFQWILERQLLKKVRRACERKAKLDRTGRKLNAEDSRQYYEEILKVREISVERIKADSKNMKNAKSAAKEKMRSLSYYPDPRKKIVNETDSDEDVSDLYEYVAAENPQTILLRRQIMDLTLPYPKSIRLQIRRLLVHMGHSWMKSIVRETLENGQQALSIHQCNELLLSYKDEREQIIKECRIRRCMRSYLERRRKEQEQKENEAEEEPQPGCSHWGSPGRGRKRRSSSDDDSPKGKSARRQLFRSE
ncbi:hypothetical protein TKK_0003152 [Trichogramma kaykai]